MKHWNYCVLVLSCIYTRQTRRVGCFFSSSLSMININFSSIQELFGVLATRQRWFHRQPIIDLVGRLQPMLILLARWLMLTASILIALRLQSTFERVWKFLLRSTLHGASYRPGRCFFFCRFWNFKFHIHNKSVRVSGFKGCRLLCWLSYAGICKSYSRFWRIWA